MEASAPAAVPPRLKERYENEVRPQLQEELEVPVVGVITPEAHAAVQATRNRRIGLLA